VPYDNKSVFMLVNSALLAAERRRPPLLIDISFPHGAQQQTRRMPLL